MPMREGFLRRAILIILKPLKTFPWPLENLTGQAACETLSVVPEFFGTVTIGSSSVTGVRFTSPTSLRA